jgi:AcrR family transcriptional regulator
MIYHYFASKDGLYAALLERRLGGLDTRLDDWLDGVATEDPDHVRLLMWEALESAGTVVREDERTAAWRRLVDEVALRRGVSREEARQLALALVSIVLFPVAFPQLTRMIADATAADSALVDARRALLATLLDAPSAKPRYRLAPRVT